MRTARFLVTGAPFDITATRRPPPDGGSKIWVVVEDTSGTGAFRPAIGWLELPEEMHGHEDEVARGLEVEVAMRMQMGPERDRVEALAAMLDGDAVRSPSWPEPIAFESPAVPNLLRQLAGSRKGDC
jgi:hypothetical protein